VVAAVRGRAPGRTVIKIKVAWYLTKDLNEGWEFDDDHNQIAIHGEPSVETRFRFIAPDS